MKQIILAIALMSLAQTSAASSFFIECTTANGSITNLSGHDWKTEVRLYDKQTGKEIVVEVPGANLDILETYPQIEEIQKQSECSQNGISWGLSRQTYAVKAQLNLPEDTNEEIKAFVGKEARIYLCEEEATWLAPCE